VKSWLLAAGLAVCGCEGGSRVQAAECVLDYGGESRTVVVEPTSDPYRVQPLNIDDVFEFKAVYVTAPADVAVLDLYTYHVSERGPVIIEQTKYRPPFPKNGPGAAGTFTGSHYVYGPNGAEFLYSCRWRTP
jgi:hypothetical protein